MSEPRFKVGDLVYIDDHTGTPYQVLASYQYEDKERWYWLTSGSGTTFEFLEGSLDPVSYRDPDPPITREEVNLMTQANILAHDSHLLPLSFEIAQRRLNDYRLKHGIKV